MTDKEAKELAEAHWKYTETIIKFFEKDEELIGKFKTIYVLAYIHGIKHGRDVK